MATLEQAIDGYTKLREQRDQLRKEAKEKEQPVLEAMAKLEVFLLAQLNDMGLSKASSSAATAYVSERVSATVKEWGETLPFILNGHTDLLERKVNKTAVLGHIKETGQPVPGVKVTRMAVVNVRRI